VKRDSTVSIVIPTFNRSGMLGKAVQSALEQTVHCEIIVADHGSTDDTPTVMKAYEGRVSYLRREQDNGPLFAWADGIVSATSEYVHITYDDDWIAPEFIEECLNLFERDCAFVFCAADIQWPDGGVVHQYKNHYQTGTHPVQVIEDYLFSIPLTISPGCALFRRKDILSAMLVDRVPTASHYYRGAGTDLLMFLMPLLNYPKFGFVNKPLAFFTAHPGSITVDATANAEKALGLKRGYEEIRKYYLIVKDALARDRGRHLLRRATAMRLIRRAIRHLRRIDSFSSPKRSDRVSN
jgi:glycosyltransferase involved in cell wall biosynthesis